MQNIHNSQQTNTQSHLLHNDFRNEFFLQHSDQASIMKEESQKNVTQKKNKETSQENIRTQKMRNEMKKIGIDIQDQNLDKNQFAKTLSNVIGNFFNPLINRISVRQRQTCAKLGLLIQPSDDNLKAKMKSNGKQKKQSIVQSNVKQEKIYGPEHQLKGHRQMKRRIIRKIISKTPPTIKRNNEQKVLVKQMEENFDCKLKNNRLYIKGMPKKPVSSFFFFFKDHSKKIHDDNQQLQISKQVTYGSALAKRISQRWKEMTNQQKLPYKLLSVKTREAYQKSMEEFKNQNKEVFDNFKKIKRIKANETRRIKIKRDTQDNEVELQEEENSQSQKIQTPTDSKFYHQKKQAQLIDLENEDLPIMIPQEQDPKGKKKKTSSRQLRQRFKSIHKPKSPSPSFFFFYNEKKGQISKDHGVTRGANITQIASGMWRGMSDDEKLPYELMANQRRKQYYDEMKRFEIDYPEEWTQMVAHRRRVTGGSVVKKIGEQVQSNENNLERSHIEEENSQSIQEEGNNQIDSLEGTVILKKSISKKSNQNQKNQKVFQLKQTSSVINESEKDQKQKKQLQNNKTTRLKSTSKDKKKQLEAQKDQKGQRPKAPVSSFFMFYRQNNSILANQFKETNGGKLVQYASQIWKNMTEQQKKPYQIQAEESRRIYYHEMEIYKQKYPQEIKQRRIDLKKKHSEQSEDKNKPSKSRKKPTRIQSSENNKE